MTTTEFNSTYWKNRLKVSYNGTIHEIEALDFVENLILINGYIWGESYWVRCENAKLFDGETAPNEEPIILTGEQTEILEHTICRAAGGLHCGGGADMVHLVSLGLMEEAGKDSVVPDIYYRATAEGHRILKKIGGRQG